MLKPGYAATRADSLNRKVLHQTVWIWIVPVKYSVGLVLRSLL